MRAQDDGSAGPTRFHRVRTFLGFSAGSRLLLLLAVIGPGIITANVDNDPGGITTYSMAGATFGYALLWTMLPILIALAVIQEMCVRMGVVTGKGLADLIRENFGIKLTFYVLVALLFTNIFNTMSEFAGVAAASELFGVSRYIAVPMVLVFVSLLVLKAGYSLVEKVFLGACVFYVAYVIAAVLAKPQWGVVGRASLVPHVQLSSPFLVMVIGLVGTTIAPWMQFYIQSSTVEKAIKVKELPYSRVDVITGSFMTQIVAAFIIITCAATLFKAGIKVNSAAEAARALQPLAGETPPFCLPLASWWPGCSPPASCPSRPPITFARDWAGRRGSTTASRKPGTSTPSSAPSWGWGQSSSSSPICP